MSATGWVLIAVVIGGVAVIAIVLANRQSVSNALGGTQQPNTNMSVLQKIFGLAGADEGTTNTVGDVGDVLGALTSR